MSTARPTWQDVQTEGFGLAWPLLAAVVLGSAWLLAHAAIGASAAQDVRRIEFVRSAAAIQGRLQLLRGLEKSVLVSTASPGKSAYYQARRDQARRRIGELTRSAGAIAKGAGEHARLAQLAALVRAADGRYQQIIAAAGTAPRLAMQSEEPTVVQPKGERP